MKRGKEVRVDEEDGEGTDGVGDEYRKNGKCR